MKISIQIEDATPEEVRGILFAAAGPEKVTISPTAHKPADGLQTTKETPPTHKKEAKKVPADKPSSSEWRSKNAKVPKWAGKEKKTVSDCATKEEAWEKYQVAYPGQRNQSAVFQRFAKLKGSGKKSKGNGKKPVETVATPSGQSSDNVATPTDDADPSQEEWSLEEDAAIRECPSEDMALTHFLTKFPESERTAVEVSERWKELSDLREAAAGES
jgi:hypothetical protein